MPMTGYLPDESSPVYAITDPERAQTIGWEDLPAQDAEHSPAAINDGSIRYSQRDIEGAWQLATAPLRAFFGISQDQAPFKKAEDDQFGGSKGGITYAVSYADQDYRRINEANNKLTQFRSRLPKVPNHVGTAEIIGNLSAAPAQGLGSSDDELMAMLGIY
jgi:hypothetical protein